MSHTAQQALPLRPAAVVVALLHAGLVLGLLSALNFPAKEAPPFVPTIVPVTADKPSEPRRIEASGPGPFEEQHAHVDEPTVEFDEFTNDDAGATALAQPPSGGPVPATAPDFSRMEILSRTDIEYPWTAKANDEQGVVLLRVHVGA